MTSAAAVPVDTYESERHFHVWRYQVGHSQLLLRSAEDTTRNFRIDLLFKAVDRIDLPTSFDELNIVRQGRDFDLSGQGWVGRDTAGICVRAEDEGEYFDQSPFETSF
jgi:hypothetical protein